MLAGSVHPTLAALLSAHQSIGVPEPVKVFGTEEQKQRFLPRCAAGAVTAFVVETDTPGVTVEQRNAFMGLRGIENVWRPYLHN